MHAFNFFKKMGQSRPLFCLFSFFSRYNFNTNWKKHRWCAWDSNPGPQDGRRRRNHGAMLPYYILRGPSEWAISRNKNFCVMWVLQLLRLKCSSFTLNIATNYSVLRSYSKYLCYKVKADQTKVIQILSNEDITIIWNPYLYNMN